MLYDLRHKRHLCLLLSAFYFNYSIELRVGNIYLINWGKTTSELYILELTADGVRGTLTKNKNNLGAWYFMADLESRVVKQLNQSLL